MIYAKFPLNCRALKDANEAVYAKHKDIKPGDKLTMGPEHGKHRVTWMHAYKESLRRQGIDPKTKVSTEKQTPDGPVTDCPKPSPVQVSTVIVRVWDKKTKQPLPGASVKLTYEIPTGSQKTTNSNGRAVFSPVTPRPKDYTVWAWKGRKSTWRPAKGKVYHTELTRVHVGVGETKTVDIYLEGEDPLDLVITVRDWNKQLVPQASVVLGSPPKPKPDGTQDTSRGPVYLPGVPYMTAHTDSQGTLTHYGIAYGRYMLHAKKRYRAYVYRRTNPRQTGSLPTESDRKVVSCLDRSKRVYRAELELKRPPATKKFKIWIQSGAWASQGLGPFFRLGITLVFRIQDTETARTADYRGSFGIYGGSLSKSVIKGLPGGATMTTGPGKPKAFVLQRFMGNNELVDETSFANSSARLDLAKVEAGITLLNFFNLHIGDPSITIGGLETGPTTWGPPSAEITAGISVLPSKLAKL